MEEIFKTNINTNLSLIQNNNVYIVRFKKYQKTKIKLKILIKLSVIKLNKILKLYY